MHSSPPPLSSRRAPCRAPASLAVALVLSSSPLMVVPAAVRAAELALTGADGVPAPPPRGDRSVQAGEADCAAWTDRCVVCERRAEGRVSCSNIGIACQPQAVQCVGGGPEAKPLDQKPD